MVDFAILFPKKTHGPSYLQIGHVSKSLVIRSYLEQLGLFVWGILTIAGVAQEILTWSMRVGSAPAQSASPNVFCTPLRSKTFSRDSIAPRGAKRHMPSGRA